MTTRKNAEVSTPAIPADEAFGNGLIEFRDAAFLKAQALRNDYATREAYFDREAVRLEDRRRKELGSISKQIAQQDRVLAGADAGLEALNGNVVALKTADE